MKMSVMLSDKQDSINMKSASSDRRCRIVESIVLAAVVIISVCVVMIALLNSIQWHIQRFWGISGNFWNGIYKYLYEHYGKLSPFLFLMFGMGLSSHIPFILLNLPLLIIDVFEWPSWLTCYKIQPHRKLNVQRLPKLLKQVIFNQIIVASITAFIFCKLQFLRSPGVVTDDIPTFQRYIIDITIFSFVEEILFYYFHRLAHHPSLYKYVHKQHHEWKTSIGLTCVYAHPIEHTLVNLIPVLAGPLLTGAHASSIWIWLVITIISTIISHCGYHFPFLPSPESHDYHHVQFNNNFGVLGILDKLHGTDIHFKNSDTYQYHYVSMCLKPFDRKDYNKSL
ncbi:hypothetical protein A3Q56_00826 [Intoshia linei]|uniref:Fatty acid hydroxylase domain-containing protein n=1 Tax=Intoshia linei TaxID=1819745 RepID=A0A177BAQ1_9BILA|nr:hypothetical protein A3Q56_00826 [Intoshia linei]